MSVSVHDVRRAMHELGRFRFGDMQVEDAMAEIVRVTHAIFDVDGAGLMLADADQHLRNVAVSDDRLAHLEDLQIQYGEGPCIDSYHDKQMVQTEDLVDEGRWPDFRGDAVQRGIRAVLATPIPFNQEAVGVVTVVSEKPHPWSPEGELALLAFTDLAALLIASMMQGQQKSQITDQLQGALTSRAVIERAKGVLIERDKISAREAYERLRGQARSQRRKLSDVAEEVVRSAETSI